MSSILLVEDRESLRRLLERALRQAGHEVLACGDLPGAHQALAERSFDLVLTDLKLPSGEGTELLEAPRRRAEGIPVVVLTAYGSVQTAVEAMKRGAADFLEKPIEIGALEQLVERWVGARAQRGPRAGCLELPGVPPILGEHPRFVAALRLLERVAPTESTVLLLGPSGSGKELFARALHALSRRGAGPFVAVNCAAIPESLVEAELFGHEKGAFTGADRKRPGRFEQARGGTLFLDEIGELPLAVQAKVLRVLDGGGFERIGGRERLESEARVVSATNRDLAELVEAGRFRADLLYRLEVFPIEVPGLAERRSDIVPLAEHLIARHAGRQGLDPPSLTAEAREWLERQAWPGNVRQLSNLMERAVVLYPGERLDLFCLQGLAGARHGGSGVRGSERERDAAVGERHELERALEASGFEVSAAAERLGWPRRKLERKLREHGLQGRPRAAREDPPSGGG